MISKILTTAKKQVAFLLAIALTATLVSGCAGQKLGKQTVVVKHYPECYRPISDLREAAKKVNQATAASAIFGAISGAAIAYGTGGSKADIAKAAVAGGLTGAGLGYLISSEVQAMDQAERFRTYYQAMDMDISSMKQAVAAAKITSNCYKKQYQLMTKNYKAGRMDQAEMYERLNEIRNGTNDATTILRNYSETSQQLASTFDQVESMERDRPDRASANLIRGVTQKRTNFEREVKNSETLTSAMVADMDLYNQDIAVSGDLNRRL
ncbi:MAG: hypothetical protein LBT38_06195 [Deltaproteobacteria bacterium]|nr:hypothetical protein [Deltaproteobacteria bacterium]